MGNHGNLSVYRLRGKIDFPPECHANALVSQADAKNRFFAMLQNISAYSEIPRTRRMARAGGNHDTIGIEIREGRVTDLIIAKHCGAYPGDAIDQVANVIREGVIVVD